MASRGSSGGLKEWVALSRRTGWGFGGQAQMGEDLEDHVGIFDGGNMPPRAPTLETDGQVDCESLTSTRRWEGKKFWGNNS